MALRGDADKKCWGMSPDDFLLAYFGYVSPEKGIETLLEAFRLVAQRSEKVRLVMVGGSNEVLLKVAHRPRCVQELQDLSERLGIAGRVVWTGYYPTGSDQPSLYLRGADGCVLPFNDGVHFHNSSFTAVAAHGLPIVTTKGDTLESPLIDTREVSQGGLMKCNPVKHDWYHSSVRGGRVTHVW